MELGYQDFVASYAGMSDADLAQVAEDVRDLQPAAREALQVELGRRKLNVQALHAELASEDDARLLEAGVVGVRAGKFNAPKLCPNCMATGATERVTISRRTAILSPPPWRLLGFLTRKGYPFFFCEQCAETIRWTRKARLALVVASIVAMTVLLFLRSRLLGDGAFFAFFFFFVAAEYGPALIRSRALSSVEVVSQDAGGFIRFKFRNQQYAEAFLEANR